MISHLIIPNSPLKNAQWILLAYFVTGRGWDILLTGFYILLVNCIPSMMSFCSVISLLRWMTGQERVKLVLDLLTSNQFTIAGSSLSTVLCDYPLSYTVLPACCLAKADWEEMTVKKYSMATPAVHSTRSLSLEPASVVPAFFLGGCLMVSSVPGLHCKHLHTVASQNLACRDSDPAAVVWP